MSHCIKQLPVLGFDATEFGHRERTNEPEDIQILQKVFMELPIHALLNTKYCQMRQVELDFYAIQYVPVESRLGGLRATSADQDNGISPRYQNKEAGGSTRMEGNQA